MNPDYSLSPPGLVFGEPSNRLDESTLTEWRRKGVELPFV